MKTEKTYTSDCGKFKIISDHLIASHNDTEIPVGDLIDLHKFLSEYLQDKIEDEACQKTGYEEKLEYYYKEKLFLYIIEGGKWDNDYYISKNGDTLIDNGETGNVRINYHLLWTEFYDHFKMEHEGAKEFMKDMLLQHFKIEGKEPTPLFYSIVL